MRLLFFCTLIAVFIGTFFMSPPSDEVAFLDVGQGDAILIQNGTRQVLIDGGQGMTVMQRLAEEMPWFDRKIEVIIATHPDRDHLEGLLHVLERYEVGLVLLPQMPHSSQLQSAWLDKLQELAKHKKIVYRFAWAGQKLSFGDQLQLKILGPFADNGQIYVPGQKTNNAAILTRVDFNNLAFLLTSDAENAIEHKLVTKENKLLEVDVLKAGHHGSKTSTTQELLNAATPSAVIISVGENNRYGHPHPDVMKRLESYQVWRTDENGSIRFKYIDNNWLLSFRDQ